MPTSTALENILTPALTVLGFELVSCQFVSEYGRRTLRVLIDGIDGGKVTVEECSRVSRQIDAILSAESSSKEAYDLEVSSPGLDRPLVTLAHYLRFIGCQVKVKLRQPLAGQRNFTGQLLSATQDVVQLSVDGKTIDLDFNAIEKTNVVPEMRF